MRRQANSLFHFSSIRIIQQSICSTYNMIEEFQFHRTRKKRDAKDSVDLAALREEVGENLNI